MRRSDMTSPCAGALLFMRIIPWVSSQFADTALSDMILDDHPPRSIGMLCITQLLRVRSTRGISNNVLPSTRHEERRPCPACHGVFRHVKSVNATMTLFIPTNVTFHAAASGRSRTVLDTHA
ncbi:hypothetical protein C8Q74DRAFT_657417 [Fomes fomentarius]|nr:hypothetical protein C8Q74DRAFT_657417 [Fomes fomentarius]